MTLLHCSAPPITATYRLEVALGLALRAELVGGTWCLTWWWRGVLVDADPYVAGCEEPS